MVRSPTLRSRRATAALVLFIVACSCIEREVEGDVLRVRFGAWVPYLTVCCGLALLILGWRMGSGRGRPPAYGRLRVAVLAAGAFVTFSFYGAGLDPFTLDRGGFVSHTGSWIHSTHHVVRFAELAEIEVRDDTTWKEPGERKKRHLGPHLKCTGRDGSVRIVPKDDRTVAALPTLLERASEAGVRVVDSRRISRPEHAKKP